MLTDRDTLQLFGNPFELHKLVSRKVDLAKEIAREENDQGSYLRPESETPELTELRAGYDAVCLEIEQIESKLGGLLNAYIGG